MSVREPAASTLTRFVFPEGLIGVCGMPDEAAEEPAQRERSQLESRQFACLPRNGLWRVAATENAFRSRGEMDSEHLSNYLREPG